MKVFLFICFTLPFYGSANTNKPMKSMSMQQSLSAKNSQRVDGANLSNILNQARMVPNRNAETGEIDGFVLLSIEPNSQFEKLGYKEGDVITAEKLHALQAK